MRSGSAYEWLVPRDFGLLSLARMSTLPDSEDALIGIRLDGRYHITGVLGRGGMGIVYEGVHEQLGRAVAIKVLSADTATDPVVAERFMREARIASSLGHGNIVDVSDLGRLADGRSYLVMPRVQGVDLATRLADEGPMPPARVAELLHGVAAALDLVHAKGLAHRDVKPDNLLHVVREDGSETVMLTDFGIASLIAVKAARLTAEGMVCGTPAYVAPELVATGEFDGRADVYALATVAFELLTGRLPFGELHPTRLLAAKVERDALSLGAASRRRFARALEDVIACGLARDPERRFQSAGAFVAALKHAAQEVPRDDDVVDAPTLRVQAVRGRPLSTADAREHAPAREPAQLGRAAVRSGGIEPVSPPALEVAQGSRTHAAGSYGALDDTRNRKEQPIVRRRTQAWLLAAGAFGAGFLAWVSIGWSSQPSRDAAPVFTPVQAAASVPAPIASGVAAARPPLPPARAQLPPSTKGLPAREARRAPQPAPPHARARAERTPNEQRKTAVPEPPPSPASRRPEEPTTSELNRAANQELLQGRLDRALELFERASEQDPDSAPAHRGLAVVYERLGRAADAVQAYRRALDLQPRGPQAAALRERLQKLQAAR